MQGVRLLSMNFFPTMLTNTQTKRIVATEVIETRGAPVVLEMTEMTTMRIVIETGTDAVAETRVTTMIVIEIVIETENTSTNARVNRMEKDQSRRKSQAFRPETEWSIRKGQNNHIHHIQTLANSTSKAQ